jgi:hypothetical protein
MSIFARKLALPALVAILATLSLPVMAADSGGLIAQGFQTQDTNISPGALVSLEEDSADAVELANTQRAARLVGVAGEDAFLEVSDANSSVQVVVSGVAGALVSDLNGNVKTGDRVAVSPVAGVGMRATTSGVVLGIAQADLDSVDTAQRTVDGESINIGTIPVQVNVAAYVVPGGGSSTPEWLQGWADAVAGKSVSPLRVLIAALLVILLFAAVVALLYSAVRSSLISIGRNPLSENALRKSLLQVGLMALGIVVVGMVVVYLVLKV